MKANIPRDVLISLDSITALGRIADRTPGDRSLSEEICARELMVPSHLMERQPWQPTLLKQFTTYGPTPC